MVLLNLLLTGYIGLVLGGFVTVLIPRLGSARPETLAAALKTVSLPPSSCICGRHLSALEKAPVLGWLATRGLCRTCGARVTAAYPAIECLVAALLLGIVIGAADLQPGQFALLALVPGSLLVLTIGLLPVAPTAASVLGLLVSLWLTVAISDPQQAATGGVLLLATLLWRRIGGPINPPVRVVVALALAMISQAIPETGLLGPLLIGAAAVLAFRLPCLFERPQTAQ